MSPQVGKKMRIKIVQRKEFIPRRAASRLTYAVKKMNAAKKMLIIVMMPARAREASTR